MFYKRGNKGIGVSKIIMWVVSGLWESMSHKQYKCDKDCGNVMGLGGDVVGWGSCGGKTESVRIG